MIFGGAATGSRQTFAFDVTEEELRTCESKRVTISFNGDTAERAFFFLTADRILSGLA